MPSAQRFLLSCAVCLALAVAGCGGDSSSPATSAEGEAANESWPAGEVGSKVSVPEGPPPKGLVIKDLEKGSGPAAKPGDEVEFEYVDALYSTGEVLSVAVPGAPFHLELGSHGSIPGWEKGIVGMRVGGRREVIIPPRLGYGQEGSSSVPPGSTLLLQVALVGIG
jgi:peptidylprolyl isomerase